MNKSDVLIIGAGPAGATAAALLNKRGYHCRIIERQTFPRFSIGESLLPQCMDILDEAGLLPAVQQAHYQLKDGARFLHHGRYATFEFSDQFTPGWEYTYEVIRADFDKLLADQAAQSGVDIIYDQAIEQVRFEPQQVLVSAEDAAGDQHNYAARFILDASGFGRVLPRLLSLQRPSSFPLRQSYFTHIEDNIDNSRFDRNKILVTIHPQHRDVWFWLIPFNNGRSSVGVTATREFLDSYPGDGKDKLANLMQAEPELARILQNCRFDTPVNSLQGYATNVSAMYGPKYGPEHGPKDGAQYKTQGAAQQQPQFALLGNAGEFLDPIFSSGVTIALRSASLAAKTVDKTLQGLPVDWEKEFTQALGSGVGTFKAFVESWYDGSLQDIFFAPTQQPRIKRLICSILAGYAWDTTNMYTSRAKSRLQVLAGFSRA